MSYYINGSNEIDYSQLASLSTPQGMTNTHYPIHHKTFTDLVINKVTSLQYTINEARYGIDDHGDMFGYLKLEKNAERNGTFNHVIGLRNSHCQRFSAALAAGSSVMVCDNLAFSGDIEVGHKHTKNIMDKLPGRIDIMMQEIQDNWQSQAKRYDAYAATELSQSGYGELLWNAIDQGALSGSKAQKVINEYAAPRHEDFEDRNAWSLFNAFTEILKESPTMLRQRSIQLHSVFDEYCETGSHSKPESLQSRLDFDGDALDKDLDAQDVYVAQTQSDQDIEQMLAH
jgi:hypothetical protein